MKFRFVLLIFLFTFGLLMAQNVEDFETGSFGENPWVLSGDADFFVSLTQAHGGLYSAENGNIVHSQSSAMSITIDVTDPSPISFWWRTDSESNYDKLKFYIDGEMLSELSGDMAWQEVTHDVAAGSHDFMWEYSKDGSVDTGADTGWVDDITFPTTFIYDNDMACTTISGPAYANVGGLAIYDITVRNSGYNAVSSYDVTLMKGGDEIETITISQSLAFEETRVHSIPWTVPESEENNTVIMSAVVSLNNDQSPGNDTSGNASTYIFPPGIIEVTVGEGTISDNKTPLSFPYGNSIAEMLYFPDEVQMDSGSISGLKFQYNFNETISTETVNIWVGETMLPSLFDGFIPAGQLQQVYAGQPYFNGNSENNWVNIEFQTNYDYNGGNLVVLVQNSMTLAHGEGTNFIHDSSTVAEHEDRTRYNRDDLVAYDPYAPPTAEDSWTYETFPNIILSFYTGPKGILEGYVYDEDGNPVQDAEVSPEGLSSIAISDADGHYLLPDILEGEYSFIASKYGYDEDEHVAEIVQDETTDLDFTITAWSSVSLSGFVYASDDLDTPLPGATVTLSGAVDMEFITHIQGYFIFNNVYTNESYEISVDYEGYESYNATVEVEEEDVDLGALVVTEPTEPPSNVSASQDAGETTAAISWNSPGIGGSEFRYDDDAVDSEIGMAGTNSVLGAVHANNSVVHSISWYLTDAHDSHGTLKLLLFGLDEGGMPDQSNLLYNSGTVLNIDNQWNTYELPAPVNTPSGFFVGVCTNGAYTDVALDDGVGAPYEYQNGTHYAIQNYTDSTDDWIAMESFGYAKNMMIRAFGINYGVALRDDASDIPNRSFEGYNIYRLETSDEYNPEEWLLVAEAIADTTYADETWQSVDEGSYKYAVKTNYTNSVESMPVFSDILYKTFSSITDDEIVLQRVRNYPNPFHPVNGKRNSGTNISFTLKNTTDLKIEIYNVRGQLIKVLANDNFAAGAQQVYWDGRDGNAKNVTSGVYFYKIQSTDITISRKMLLIK